MAAYIAGLYDTAVSTPAASFVPGLTICLDPTASQSDYHESPGQALIDCVQDATAGRA
jgi:hypothetical protein